MEISYVRRSTETINLPMETVNELTCKRLRQLVHPGEFLQPRGDKVYLRADDEHYHGSTTSHDVREATQLDIAVFTVLKALEGS